MLPLSACQAEKKTPSSSTSDSRNELMVTVHPAALSGPISNPGVGVETFHNSWGVSLTSDQYPASGVDYYRFYWSDLEPKEGEYAFDTIDRLLALNQAQQPAKMVALRFMTADEPWSGSKIPTWLINKGIRGVWTQDGKTFVPDLDDNLYLYYVEKLLNALGQRYDGNPSLSH
ncbi:beta-galactosidase, partial [Vibrio parahaemolyticus]|nr:beta-galactosidase [Vibrio parahaemolyticus]